MVPLYSNGRFPLDTIELGHALGIFGGAADARSSTNRTA